MKSFKIYYINLDKSIQRRAFMENQFKKLNIPATRMWQIINSPEQYKEAQQQAINITDFFLNDGEIGH